jgi:hypothetical protein
MPLQFRDTSGQGGLCDFRLTMLKRESSSARKKTGVERLALLALLGLRALWSSSFRYWCITADRLLRVRNGNTKFLGFLRRHY